MRWRALLSPMISVSTLRFLALKLGSLDGSSSEPTYQLQAFRLFITSITIFYKEVTRLKPYLDLEYLNVSYVMKRILRYISNTPRLLVLKLKSDSFPLSSQHIPPVRLEILEELNVRCLESLQYLQPTNLQFLRMSWPPTRSIPRSSRASTLQKS
jgi:hypothetical protein